MKIKSNKLNKKITNQQSQNDIISFGFFPNYFNLNNNNNNNNNINNCNEYKEYKISIIGNDLNSQILINNANEKLLKKSQLNKINNNNCNNIIATISVPKNNKKQSYKRLSSNLNNKSRNLTWVYYSYDCYGSKKTIYDDNNSNQYPNNDELKCSSCNSDNERIFKVNNGMVECYKCLNINQIDQL